MRKITSGSALLLLLGAAWCLLRAPARSQRASSTASPAAALWATAMAVARPSVRVSGPRAATALGPARGARLERYTFADLRLSRASEQLLHRAEELAVARCMEGRGFLYLPTPYDDSGAEAADFERIDPEDPHAARALGYGLASDIAHGDVRNHADDQNRDELAELEPAARAAYQQALLGIPQSGQDLEALAKDPNVGMASVPDGPTMVWDRTSCVAEARRQLYGDDVREQTLHLRLQSLQAQVEEQVDDERDVRASLARWRSCISARGHDYEAPQAGAEALAGQYHAGKLSLDELAERERQLAEVDADCQQTAQLAATRARAGSRLEQSAAERNQDLLAEVHAMHTSSLARSQSWLEPESASESE